MHFDRNRFLSIFGAAALGAALAAGGCASGTAGARGEGLAPERGLPERTARWIPRSAPSFITIEGDTTYAMVFRPDADTLELEDRFPEDPGRALTWLIVLPLNVPMDRPIPIGPGGLQAWLVEDVRGEGAHAAPVRGRITVQERTADSITAAVDLSIRPEPRTAGAVSDPAFSMAGRVMWRRYEPSRSGAEW